MMKRSKVKKKELQNKHPCPYHAHKGQSVPQMKTRSLKKYKNNSQSFYSGEKSNMNSQLPKLYKPKNFTYDSLNSKSLQRYSTKAQTEQLTKPNKKSIKNNLRIRTQQNELGMNQRQNDEQQFQKYYSIGKQMFDIDINYQYCPKIKNRYLWLKNYRNYAIENIATPSYSQFILHSSGKYVKSLDSNLEQYAIDAADRIYQNQYTNISEQLQRIQQIKARYRILQKIKTKKQNLAYKLIKLEDN